MAAVGVLVLLAAVIGGLLGVAVVRFKVEGDPLIDRIDQILPQTQCGQCGFPGCRPYATAIRAGEADINHCPPGGQATIDALAELLGVESKPLDPERGEESEVASVAWIDEQVQPATAGHMRKPMRYAHHHSFTQDRYTHIQTDTDRHRQIDR